MDYKGGIVDEAARNTPRHIWDWRPVTRLLPQARRFILTDAASEKLGRIVDKTDELILENHQFAIAPYPVTYVELASDRFHVGLDRPTTEDLGYGDEVDTRMGALITNERVWFFADASRVEGMPTGPMIAPVGLARGGRRGPWHPSSDWWRLSVLLGSSVHAITSEQVKQEILSQWDLVPQLIDWHLYEKEMIHGGAGDCRTLLALLLVLNQPHVINLEPRKARSGISGGRRRNYWAHSVVEIELGRRRNYKKLIAQGLPRRSPRAHEVRGHFVHFNLGPGCSHQWPSMPEIKPDGSPRWICSKCGGLRTWRDAHVRGDASTGFTTKDYEVIS